MNVTGTSSYIKIEYEGKTVKAQGEMVVNGFVAYINTMKAWEPPASDELFNGDIRAEIISRALKYCEDKEFKIVFA